MSEPPQSVMARRRGALRRPQKKTIQILPKAPTVNVNAWVPSPRRVCVTGSWPRPYSSSGNSFNSASENTGPSTHTYFGPTLQRPQMPMPHFMRFSRVV